MKNGRCELGQERDVESYSSVLEFSNCSSSGMDSLAGALRSEHGMM